MVTELDVLISMGSRGPQRTGQMAAPNDQGRLPLSQWLARLSLQPEALMEVASSGQAVGIARSRKLQVSLAGSGQVHTVP